jgi:hypothetical protein
LVAESKQLVERSLLRHLAHRGAKQHGLPGEGFRFPGAGFPMFHKRPRLFDEFVAELSLKSRPVLDAPLVDHDLLQVGGRRLVQFLGRGDVALGVKQAILVLGMKLVQALAEVDAHHGPVAYLVLGLYGLPIVPAGCYGRHGKLLSVKRLM